MNHLKIVLQTVFLIKRLIVLFFTYKFLQKKIFFSKQTYIYAVNTCKLASISYSFCTLKTKLRKKFRLPRFLLGS